MSYISDTYRSGKIKSWLTLWPSLTIVSKVHQLVVTAQVKLLLIIQVTKAISLKSVYKHITIASCSVGKHKNNR
ncbi:hypothetical protein EUGRSUZ_F00444 [Eucalyptus grandis]|uniref:Uncharacterized protein n=2 Tax=Eucalyptus grandis TaxID=71139 RepID=A0ACC3KAN7_EUCGR|nr:hypothetical protein EUGRSUZ_F00444 [Eucalyptus grandis]